MNRSGYLKQVKASRLTEQEKAYVNTVNNPFGASRSGYHTPRGVKMLDPHDPFTVAVTLSRTSVVSLEANATDMTLRLLFPGPTASYIARVSVVTNETAGGANYDTQAYVDDPHADLFVNKWYQWRVIGAGLKARCIDKTTESGMRMYGWNSDFPASQSTGYVSTEYMVHYGKHTGAYDAHEGVSVRYLPEDSDYETFTVRTSVDQRNDFEMGRPTIVVDNMRSGRVKNFSVSFVLHAEIKLFGYFNSAYKAERSPVSLRWDYLKFLTTTRFAPEVMSHDADKMIREINDPFLDDENIPPTA